MAAVPASGTMCTLVVKHHVLSWAQLPTFPSASSHCQYCVVNFKLQTHGVPSRSTQLVRGFGLALRVGTSRTVVARAHHPDSIVDFQ